MKHDPRSPVRDLEETSSRLTGSVSIPVEGDEENAIGRSSDMNMADPEAAGPNAPHWGWEAPVPYPMLAVGPDGSAAITFDATRWPPGANRNPDKHGVFLRLVPAQ
jgi:hypothetical protein